MLYSKKLELFSPLLEGLTSFIIDMFYFLTGIEGKNIYGEDGLFLLARFPKTVKLFFSDDFC